MNWFKLFILSLIFLVPIGLSNFTNTEKQFIEPRNILNNPGFEYGLAQWGKFGAAGSSLSTTTSTSNVGSGAVAVAFDSSATDQYLGSSLVTIPAGMYGKNCLAKFDYKGADSNLAFLVVDGSGTTLGSSTLLTKSIYSTGEINFACPTSGTMGVRVNSSADAAHVFLDNIFLGEDFRDISTVATVSISYETNASQVIEVAGAGEVVVYEDKTYDTHNLYNTTTGIFTTQTSGRYLISANVGFADGQWNVGNQAKLSIRKNGTTTKQMLVESEATVTETLLLEVMHIVSLNAGDTIDIFLDHDRTSGDLALNAEPAFNTLVIHRVGN